MQGLIIQTLQVYALREGLAMLAEEGLEACHQRHRRCADRLWKGKTNSTVGVVKFFKVPFLQQFSTDLTPKVTDQPRILPVASIWSRTVVSNLKNGSNLWSSKFNPKRNSYQCCMIWVLLSRVFVFTR